MLITATSRRQDSRNKRERRHLRPPGQTAQSAGAGVRLVARKEFVTWLQNQPAGSPGRFDADAALRFLRSLPAVTTDDLPPTLKPARHVAAASGGSPIPTIPLSPFESSAGSRTPAPQSSPSLGDMATIGDLWYDSATPRAELAVDQWLRTQPTAPARGTTTMTSDTSPEFVDLDEYTDAIDDHSADAVVARMWECIHLPAWASRRSARRSASPRPT